MTFDQWLRANHYSESTTRKALGDLQRAGAQDPNVKLTLRRYLMYASQHPQHADANTIALAHKQGLEAVTRLPREKLKERKLEARSFDVDDWNGLLDDVRDSEDPCDQVLWAMGTTGARIGDVLRVPLKTLEAGLKSGTLLAVRKGGRVKPLPLGIPDPWIALARGMRKAKVENVAAYVADGDPNHIAGGAAYQRMWRHLRAICRKLDVGGRAHPHRLRRTVAVKALATSDNPVAVQQMLGHASLTSTTRYLDEVNENKTRDLQRQLAGLPREKRR